MKRSAMILVAAGAIASAFFAGCSSDDNSNGGGRGGANISGATSSSSSSSGAASSSSGSSAATGAGSSSSSGGSSRSGGSSSSGKSSSSSSSSSGTADAGVVVCSNTDKSTLPIDGTGWVDKTCNNCGIQGALYWYADANTLKTMKCGGTTCASSTPPWRAGSGMCISGTATGATTDWGAGIGLSLNDSGGTASVKGNFNASAASCGKIVGFDVTIAGNTSGMPIRVGYSNLATGTNPAPFITVVDPAGTTETLSGTSTISIAKATIPWAGVTYPTSADPTAISDLLIQVAADSATAGKTFNLCVTAIKPVFAGGGGGANCKTGSGTTLTGDLATGTLGNYGFQNNVNNRGSGTQSVTGYNGSGCVGMAVTASGITSGGSSAPFSYPSIVEGWHWGKWMGSYTSGNAKTISALTSAPSSMTFTPPAGTKWDVAYDMWVAQNKGISSPDGNTLEVMVWLDYSSGTTTNPIGSKVGTFSSGGTSWEVWYGATGSWHTVSYRRAQDTSAVTNLDMAPFLKDAVTRGTGNGSWYLLSIEAGFELFTATSGGSIDSYSLTIN